MSTFIDGIGQCQVVDKSGEIVDLKGHDITSLAKTGTFTWEHQANSPATLVGKILKAKKIFKKEECENDRELYYWNKVKTPYLYVMGELLDDYTASAKECAGQMRYSKDNADKTPLLGFSIEGSEIPNTRKGMIITRSIARKVTLTQSPCNSACVAEIYEAPEQKSQIADDFDSIFKNHDEAVTLFKSGEGTKIYEDYLAKQETPTHMMPVSSKAPKTFGQKTNSQGHEIGKIKSGKSVFSHGKVGEYGFNSGEHKEASEIHRKAALSAPNAKHADNHLQRMRLHNQAALTAIHKENRFAAGKAAKVSAAKAHASKEISKGEKICELHKGMFTTNGGERIPARELQQPNINPKSAKAKNFSPNNSRKQLAGTSIGQGESVREGNMEEAKEAAQRALKYQQRMPKPNLPKSENTSNDLEKAQVPGSKYPPSSQVSLTSVKTTAAPPKFGPISDIKKAIEAGNTNAAPSTLVNGSAYQTEHLSSSQSNSEDHNFQATKKKDWKKRAKEDYENWPHREQFEKFMKARMPHLADGEIKAIGRTIALNKSLEIEKSLGKMVGMEKALKFGSPEDQKAVAAAIEERKKNPPKKTEPAKKEPDLKSIVESEVTHVKTSGGHTPKGYSESDTVHLKSGHVLHGHPKGKFKAGDKVIAKPHLMGTHLLEHKK